MTSRLRLIDALRSIGISVAAGGPIGMTYGGQAVIEGVLMRSDAAWAIAARRPDGTVAIRHENLALRAATRRFWRLPVFRGIATLGDMVMLGMRALSWSAGVQLGEEVEIPPVAFGLTIAGSAVFAIGLFVILPLLLSQRIHQGVSPLSIVIEGVIRVALLVAYLFLIGQIGSVKTLFSYHGAEHKAINGLELGLPATPEGVAGASRLHPRCGTGFLVVVALVSVIIFAPLSVFPWWGRLVGEIILLPIVAGVGYEGIRQLARHRKAGWARAILIPILGAQLLTTREPTLPQIEVALAALAAVLEPGAREIALP